SLGNTAPSRTLVIQADLISLSAEALPEFADELGTRYGLKGADVLYNASHSHSGPQMRDSGLHCDIDPSYAHYVSSQLLLAVEEAFRNVEPVSVMRGIGICEIGI